MSLRESEDEESSSDGHPTPGLIGGYASPGSHSDLELDEEANIRSTLLQGMLPEKEPAGLQNGHGSPRRPDTVENTDSEESTEDDWKNR